MPPVNTAIEAALGLPKVTFSIDAIAPVPVHFALPELGHFTTYKIPDAGDQFRLVTATHAGQPLVAWSTDGGHSVRIADGEYESLDGKNFFHPRGRPGQWLLINGSSVTVSTASPQESLSTRLVPANDPTPLQLPWSLALFPTNAAEQRWAQIPRFSTFCDAGRKRLEGDQCASDSAAGLMMAHAQYNFSTRLYLAAEQWIAAGVSLLWLGLTLFQAAAGTADRTEADLLRDQAQQAARYAETLFTRHGDTQTFPLHTFAAVLAESRGMPIGHAPSLFQT